MKDFMNMPNLIPVTENNVIEEYKRYPDIKHVAKVYDIPVKEVRQILKQAGIKTSNTKETSNDKLKDIGMSERDFCDDQRNRL